MLRPTGIDRPDLSHFVVIFGHIDSRPSRTMNDRIGLDVQNDTPYRICVGNIQRHIRCRRHRRPISHTAISRSQITADTDMPPQSQLIHHIMTQLAIHACYKYFHRTCSLPSCMFLFIIAYSICRPQFAVRRPHWIQMPLRGKKFKVTPSPRATLGSQKYPDWGLVFFYGLQDCGDLR